MTLINQARRALLERDVQIVPIFDRATEADFAPYSGDNLFLFLNSRDEAEQRRDLHVARGRFTVILIGKDGGEKLRQHTPISVQKLDTIVDAMPMRQDEMRQKK